jgi:hypothetical protein
LISVYEYVLFCQLVESWDVNVDFILTFLVAKCAVNAELVFTCLCSTEDSVFSAGPAHDSDCRAARKIAKAVSYLNVASRKAYLAISRSEGAHSTISLLI